MKLHSQTFEAAPRESIWEGRILLRIFVKLQDGTDHFDELEIGGAKVKRRFSDLMSHSEELRQNMDRLEKVSFVGGLAKLLLGPKSKIKIPSDPELIEIYGKVSTNAFEIGDGFYTVGSGVYLGSSILNHSCEPMAERVFDGTTMHVRNIREIPKPKSLPVDQVTVCYTNPLVPSQERRRVLKKGYHFHCECERCKTGQFDKEMRSIICQGKGCNAKIDTEEMNDPCSACGHVMKKKVISEVFSAAKCVCDLLDRGKLDLPVIEGCIKKMKTLNFSDTHWAMVKLFNEAFYKAAAINASTGKARDREKAFEYGSKYFDAVKQFLHPYHKELLRSSYELSWTALGLRKLEEAEKYISEAKSIAEVLHGKNSPFMQKRIASVEEGIRRVKIIQEMKQHAGA